MKLESVGLAAFALGLFLLGSVSAISGQSIPGLQPPVETLEVSEAIARINGSLIMALSVGLSVRRFRRPAAFGLATYFSAWLIVGHAPQMMFEPFGITHLVGLVELASIISVLSIVAAGLGARSDTAAKLGFVIYGCMLLLFAGVHFYYRDFIASMIPVWIPFAALWPWFTASANLAAGLSNLTGIYAQIGGTLIGTMFASWVPIVHLPRVIAAPGDIEELTAGALALALAGAAWVVAAAGRGRRRGSAVVAIAIEVKRRLQPN